MKLVRPVMAEVEAEAARTVLQAVLDGRLLVPHDEEKVRHAIEAIAQARGEAPTDDLAAKARRRDPSTSREAAKMVTPRAKSLRGRILRCVVNAGQRGRTSYEIEQTLAIDGAWKRVSELVQGGWLSVDGERANPESRAKQQVYVATPAAIMWADGRTDRPTAQVAQSAPPQMSLT